MTETTLDDLDASLEEFERQHPPLSMSKLSDPLDELLEEEEDLEEDVDSPSETASAGGYSPPAWRKLGNGDRNNGFWRPQPVDGMPRGYIPSHPLLRRAESSPVVPGRHVMVRHEDLLQRAIETRLPRESASPEKGRSVSPEREDPTLKVEERSASILRSPSPEAPNENYIRFAVRAEVQQRTEPIETTITFLRNHYHSLTSTWTRLFLSVFIAIFSITATKSLIKPAHPRPAGDLVKMAGIARSFEPLVYYSEHAVTQIHDLQATSVAVWDLGETIRTSAMNDATSIVTDLDTLSETMKLLALEMTRFFASVDGDIDGILNTLDWASMHLNRLASRSQPGTLSSAYDNVHNLLSEAHILETPSGTPTPLGQVTTWIFGPSNPQREQRAIQRLFNELLTVLEESITSELQHSIAIFALFETVDRHFLNLARTVIRETTTQEELHADLLSGLWARIIGPKAAEVRKFEQNRMLLQDVREKTVRNKGVLIEHNGKLLTLKASLESLRSKLVSPLVRGHNATTLTLEDQIRGLTDVSGYLGDLRRQQKSKVMQNLFGTPPTKRLVDAAGV